MAKEALKHRPAEQKENKQSLEMTIANTRKQIQKIVVLPDIHYPENIDISPLVEFLKDFQPTEVIYLGDIIMGTGISKFSKVGMEEGIYDTEQELKDFKTEIHDKLKESAPNAKFVLVGGNHDTERIRKAILDMPERAELLDLKKLLPGVEIIEYGEYYKPKGSDTYYTHGHYANEMHAKKELLAVQRNLISGHTHTHQVFTQKNPLDKEPISAEAIGCLCNKNPDYAHNMPNSWVHGFGVSVIDQEGTTHNFFIRIKDGKFYFDKKLYTTGKKQK